MTFYLVAEHLGHLSRTEQIATILVGILPFIVLVTVVIVARRRDLADEESLAP